MTKTKLFDGTEVYCLRKPEAKMLDHHVEGYLQNGIEIKDGDVVFDVGANIGESENYFSKHFKHANIYCFEPVNNSFNNLTINLKGDKSAGYTTVNKYIKLNNNYGIEIPIGHMGTNKKIVYFIS